MRYIHTICIKVDVSFSTDFGFATNTYSSPHLETFCGSYAYCSPEILRGEKYRGPASDVWSMGVILYAMMCSRLPFSDDDLRFIVKKEPRKLKFSKNISQGKLCTHLKKGNFWNSKMERKYAIMHAWFIFQICCRKIT